MKLAYLIILSLGIFSYCYGDMICIEKNTGKLIEYQSNATEGTLIQNAVNSGYDINDIEERNITYNEWKIIKEEQIDKPAREAKSQEKQDKKQKEQKIKQKLSLSDQEFIDLKDALRD